MSTDVVLDSLRQRARYVLWAALAGYALLVTAAALPPIRHAWDELFGPYDAQLLIISAVPIRDVRVIYDGRAIEPRPGGAMRELQHYATFPGMRTRVERPGLQVSWEGASGAQSVSRTMRQFDTGRVCLYVLRLDAAGIAVGPEPSDEFSPFWWTCHSR